MTEPLDPPQGTPMPPTPAGGPIPPPPGGPAGNWSGVPTPPPAGGPSFEVATDVGVVPAGPAPQNGMGTTALVMGILQFFCLGTVGSILAVVFGKIGMNKAKRGEATNGGVATAGFWLGIVGLILSVLGVIALVAVIALGIGAATDSVDPARNTQTGLGDGNYALDATTAVRLNDRCAFGGTATNLDTGMVSPERVSVVGEGPTQCAGGGTPDVVMFTVSGGVADITAVQ